MSIWNEKGFGMMTESSYEDLHHLGTKTNGVYSQGSDLIPPERVSGAYKHIIMGRRQKELSVISKQMVTYNKSVDARNYSFIK